MKKLFILTAIAFAAMPAASLAQKTAEKSGGISIRVRRSEVNVGFGLGGKLKMDGQSPMPNTHVLSSKPSTAYGSPDSGFRRSRSRFPVCIRRLESRHDALFVDLKGCYPVTENFAPYIAVDLGFGMGVTGTKEFREQAIRRGRGHRPERRLLRLIRFGHKLQTVQPGTRTATPGNEIQIRR